MTRNTEITIERGGTNAFARAAEVQRKSALANEFAWTVKTRRLTVASEAEAGLA
jgi:hypothetical protein